MYNGQTILAVVPARGGSKGIPRKNIKYLAGKPMMVWSIDAAKKSKYIDRIIVSTEDKEIKDIAVQNGAEVPFLRPRDLASDNTPGIDPVLYTINKLNVDEHKKYDFVLLLQPTSPLRNEKHIDEAIETLINDVDKFDSLISVTTLEHPVYWNRVINENKELKNFIDYDKSKNYRRQNFEVIYRLNGAIYLIDTNALLKYKNFETDNTLAYAMDRRASIDVDCIEDFELVQYYINKI